MSENLKRLREEDKKIAEKFIRKHALPHWHERYYPLAGMSQIEDLERKAGEARKEEERVKEQLKVTKEELRQILEVLEEKLRIAAINEDDDHMSYVRLAEKYSDIPTAQKVFRELANEERRHAEYLRKLTNEIKREYSL